MKCDVDVFLKLRLFDRVETVLYTLKYHSECIFTKNLIVPSIKKVYLLHCLKCGITHENHASSKN